MNNPKVYHRLKENENYIHFIVSGFLIIIGIVSLFGISKSPNDILVSLVFTIIAVVSYNLIKTTKPVTIEDKKIILGKMVAGYKSTHLAASDISKIELVNENKMEDHPKALYTEGVVEKYSNYYLIYLKNNKELKFDNLYDNQLQKHLLEWCQINKVEIDLNGHKTIDISTKDIFE